MNESIITKLVKLFDGDDSVKEISLCNDVLPVSIMKAATVLNAL